MLYSERKSPINASSVYFGSIICFSLEPELTPTFTAKLLVCFADQARVTLVVSCT